MEIPDLDDLEFEKPCWNCTIYEYKREDCTFCYKGYIITTVGHRLIEFLERRGSIKLADKVDIND